MRIPCVYIMTNKRNGTLYVGVTADVIYRAWQHRNDVQEGFTKRYGLHTLVWYEMHETMPNAILREKALKEWRREWKVRLIEEMNPGWLDLYPGLTEDSHPPPPTIIPAQTGGRRARRRSQT